MLGVGVFFTLSGYLITDLLLGHWDRYGNLGLGRFWLRRARRLLPALFLLLAVISVWVALFDVAQLAAVRRQVLAAALYFSNWSTIAAHGSYFARFAQPFRWTICGRWRSRSSSMCCGPGCRCSGSGWCTAVRR